MACDSRTPARKSTYTPPQLQYVDTYALLFIRQCQSMYLVRAFEWIIPFFFSGSRKHTVCAPSLSRQRRQFPRQRREHLYRKQLKSSVRPVATKCCSSHPAWCRRLAGIWLRRSPEGVRKQRNGAAVFESPAVGRGRCFLSSGCCRPAGKDVSNSLFFYPWQALCTQVQPRQAVCWCFFFRSAGSGDPDHPTGFVLLVSFPSHLLGVGTESTF